MGRHPDDERGSDDADRVDMLEADMVLEQTLMPMLSTLARAELKQMAKEVRRTATASVRELRDQGYSWERIGAMTGSSPRQLRRVWRGRHP